MGAKAKRQARRNAKTMKAKQYIPTTFIFIFLLLITSCQKSIKRNNESSHCDDSTNLVYPIKEWDSCTSLSGSNSLKCLRQIENSIKSKLSKYAYADSFGVTIKLNNGSTKVFTNGSCENADSCVLYSLFGYIPKLDMLVLVIHYWESLEIGLVDMENGSLITLLDFPSFSPSYDKLVVSFNAEGPETPIVYDAISVWNLNGKTLKKTWTLHTVNTLMSFPEWINDSTVVIKKIEYTESGEKVVGKIKLNVGTKVEVTHEDKE